MASLLLATAEPAIAGPVPAVLTVQGVLRQSAGGLEDGAFDMAFQIYDSPTGGSSLWSETLSAVAVNSGVFSVYLGDNSAVDPALFSSFTDLYLGVTVEGDPDGELPRQRLSSTPFAFQADHANLADDADMLGGLPASSYQLAVSSSCDDGNYLAGINADGSPICGALPQGTISNVSPGSGLTGGGSSGSVSLAVDMGVVQARVTPGCAAGQAIRTIAVDGSVVCETLSSGDVTDVLTGSGSGLQGGVTSGSANLSLVPCSPNQILKYVAGSWQCATDSDTTYSAGQGMTLSSTTFSLQSCPAGTILKSTAPGSWSCAGDLDTTYTAGSGLGLSGTQFGANFTAAGGDNGSGTTVARGDHIHDSRYFTQTTLQSAGTINTGTNPVDWTKLKSVPAGFSDGVDNDSGGDITGITTNAGSGLSGGVASGTATLALTSCGNNQILKSNGVSYSCVDENDIRNGTSLQSSASLYIDGVMRTSNLVRTGAETGTQEVPNVSSGGPYAGLVIRRVNNLAFTATGHVVARTDDMFFERDTGAAGFRIRVTAGGSTHHVMCQGVDGAGTTRNKVLSPSAGTTTAVYTDAENMVYFSCMFGYPVVNGHHARVTLFRMPGDYYWDGDVISTYNQ